MGLGALYFIFVFVGLGVGLFFGLQKMELEPLVTVNKFLIYYFVADLIARYFFQKMPTALSFFNIIHAFFFIPFSIVLLAQGYSLVGIIGWHLGIMALIYINNFINVFLNDETVFVVLFGAVFVILGGLQYYGYFDITAYTEPFFQGLYEMPWLTIIPIIVLVGVAYYAFTYFLKRLYLDAGLSKKTKAASTENMEWLDRFGKGSTFLKNE